LFDVIFDPYNYPFWVLIIAILAGAIIVISRPFSTYVKFVYPNAKFEAMGNPFIGEKELDSVIDSKDIVSFKDTINTLKDYNIPGDNIFSIQRALDDTFVETVEMMRKDSSKKMNDFYNVYLKKIDIYLIKNVLRNKIEGKEINKGKIDEAILEDTKELLVSLIDSEKKDLPFLLKEYGFGQEIIDVLSNEEIDFLLLDTTIDKYLIKLLKETKLPYKCENGRKRYVNIMVDILNIKSILRGKQLGYDVRSCKNLFLFEGQEIAQWKFEQLAELESVSQVIQNIEGTSYYDALKNSIEEYNQDKSVQVLEIALDGLLLKMVRDISTQNYISIGPTLRFLVSKEFEIRNLKVIAKGISEKLSSEIIKKYLVWETS